MRRAALSALIPLLAAATPAAAAARPGSTAECEKPLPQVLNVGLPYHESAEGEPEIDLGPLARTFLEAVFRPLYEDGAKCPGRGLQVNATLGSDYQLVDWLARGSIQVAVLSDLGVHLVQREGIPLREIAAADAPGGWLASTTPEPRAWRVRAGRRTADDQPGARLEEHHRALLARARVEDDDVRARIAVHGRLVFQSHLSAVSFRPAIETAHQWLENELAAAGVKADDRRNIRKRFWDELFRRACFRLSPRPERGPGCRGHCPEDDWIEIEYAKADQVDPATAVRDRLVITQAAVEEIFSKDDPRLGPPSWKLPDYLVPLFGAGDGDPPPAPVPAFASFLGRNGYFGTRTFAFTPDEVLRLVENDQRTAARSDLALVLPGGGVKAAYQSRVIDKLYGGRRLINSGNSPDGGGAGGPLVVDYVVGTSGGALLGFFVARLGPRGPFDLSDLLWRPSSPDGGGGPEFLTSAHVFGVTDLPRYASLVTILAVFCAVLALVALRSRSWLAPPERPEGSGDGQPEAPPKSCRWRLTLTILGALVGTPLVVKLVSGGRGLEHVPELEGLLFAVLTVVAMFGDQCLVCRAVETSGGPGSRRLDWALWAGWSLVLVPALAALAVRLGELRVERLKADGEQAVLAPALEAIRLMLEASATGGVTYLVLVLLVGALLLLGARRSRSIRWWEAVRWAGAVALGTLAAGWLMTVAPAAALRWLENVPLLFFGLALTLLLTVVGRLLEAYPGARDWLARRVPSGRRTRTLLPFVVTVLVATALLDLARPRAADLAPPQGGSNLWMELVRLCSGTSKLDVPQGGLAVISGAVLLLFAVVLRLDERHNRLRLEGTRKFSDAVLAVLVGLSLLVYAVLGTIAKWSPARMTLFELTGSFWKGLLIATAALTAIALAWSRWGPEIRFTGWLTGVLRYLSGRHPNAHLVSRRFVRLLLIAAGGLAAWNFVLAPGLYGNRFARDYVSGVDRRFAEAWKRANHDEEVGASYLLSTRFLATANALEQDGTRFVLAVPEDPEAPGRECPAIRQDPGSRWHVFRVVRRSDETPKSAREVAEAQGCHDVTVEHGIEEPCTMTDGELELDCLRRYVFASGSPFPVFPAHRVPQLDGGSEALVDGGYSNNVPVEAPRTVGAGQVLIVNSSNPLARDPEGWWDRLRPLRGPLVENAPRLPGFLYQRAQQMDRLSRQNLFVVSLSPVDRPDWPFLTDFRSDVVERMRKAADRDWTERIGMVESWGPPNFQVNLQIPAVPPGA